MQFILRETREWEQFTFIDPERLKEEFTLEPTEVAYWQLAEDESVEPVDK